MPGIHIELIIDFEMKQEKKDNRAVLKLNGK